MTKLNLTGSLQALQGPCHVLLAFELTLPNDATLSSGLETTAYPSAMEEDEIIFDRYPKHPVRFIKDPIHDLSKYMSSPESSYAKLKTFVLVPICVTLSRFIDTYVILFLSNYHK